MFASLLLGLFTGHPLAFVLGGLGVGFGLLGLGPGILDMFSSRVYGIMDNYILIAIPLFIFMAQLLSRSGVSEDLFDVMRFLLGPIRGGLAIAVIIVSILFGACTGIIGASVVTMGLMALPVMLKNGYDKKLSCGVICAGGTLGILIPPSIMLIVMGNESGISVGKLFAGAIIPGFILGCLYICYVLIKCFVHPEAGPALSAEETASISGRKLIVLTCKSLLPPMALILGVLGSVFTGVATPTEASGLGALITFILILCYRKFSWPELKQSVIESSLATSMVILVVVGATCYTGVFLGLGGGNVVRELVIGMGMGKWGTFIFMMVIVFVLGMFLDWIGIVMLVFPIFLPIAQDFGFDMLWFVIIMAIMLQDSFLTPPFGYALFYLKGIAPSTVSMGDIIRGSFPFWRLMELGFIICVIFPETITWLPSVIVE